MQVFLFLNKNKFQYSVGLQWGSKQLKSEHHFSYYFTKNILFKTKDPW